MVLTKSSSIENISGQLKYTCGRWKMLSVGKVLALLEMRHYERSQKWHCVVVYAYDLAP